MSSASNIEWTDATWNPIVGCTIVSPGCTNCYAMRMAARINKMTLSSHYEGLTKKVNGNVVWTGKVARAPDYIFTAPLRWKKPKRIFVNSMGDLFHESIPDSDIDRAFAVMALCPQHTFQVLTKRAERMRDYFTKRRFLDVHPLEDRGDAINFQMDAITGPSVYYQDLPLPNVWLGISAERQQEWDERKEHLRATPAVVRFASFEPLLGPITAGEFDLSEYIDWAIVGGESGPKARPMHPDWARSLRDQCQAAGVSYFFKQWGAWSDTHADWPRCKAHAMANDGTLYTAEDIAFPDGPRYGEAVRANHDKARLSSMYLVGKKSAGRLLDGRTWDEMPT